MADGQIQALRRDTSPGGGSEARRCDAVRHESHCLLPSKCASAEAPAQSSQGLTSPVRPSVSCTVQRTQLVTFTYFPTCVTRLAPRPPGRPGPGGETERRTKIGIWKTFAREGERRTSHFAPRDVQEVRVRTWPPAPCTVVYTQLER